MLQQLPNLVLASGSPRRQQLLKDAGFEYTVRVSNTDESFPAEMDPAAVPAFLSRKKSEACHAAPEEILITADTVVVLDNRVINKPADTEEAFSMLRSLSGRSHLVYTGVSIRKGKEISTFTEKTKVFFRPLPEKEIAAYIKKYLPLDKAGAYGIQEWIGYIGITGIEGCYYNVMGFPLSRFYSELTAFISPDSGEECLL
jgi:septum formation protein